MTLPKHVSLPCVCGKQMHLSEADAEVECVKTQKKEPKKAYQVYLCPLSYTWHIGSVVPKTHKKPSKKKVKAFVKPPQVTHIPQVQDFTWVKKRG